MHDPIQCVSLDSPVLFHYFEDKRYCFKAGNVNSNAYSHDSETKREFKETHCTIYIIPSATDLNSDELTEPTESYNSKQCVYMHATCGGQLLQQR